MQIEELREAGWQCVGWYHSHPTFPVLPSSIDVFNQHTQQVAHARACTPPPLANPHAPPDAETASASAQSAPPATPYVAAIVGPYWGQLATPQSNVAWFYVENRRSADFTLSTSPEASLQHMVAKHLEVRLPEAADAARLAPGTILDAAAPLVQRYATHPERIDFTKARCPRPATAAREMHSVVVHRHGSATSCVLCILEGSTGVRVDE